MNKRIKELAMQSGMVYDSPDQGQFDDFDEQKFAELIVKECAQSLWTDECHVSDLAIEEFNSNSKRIKEHFGVE